MHQFTRKISRSSPRHEDKKIIHHEDTTPHNLIINKPFTSQLHEKWNSSLNEREVHLEFYPNFEQLKKGNRAFEWKHTIKASIRKEFKEEEVQVLYFENEDLIVLEKFLENTDKYTNLEAVNIRGINIDGELMHKLIPSLSNKKHLKKLILSVCYLKSIPQSIKKLSSLETLDLSNNQLKSLPIEIGALVNLKYLNLRNNRSFKVIPNEIGLLSKLEYLGFEGSSVIEIPNTISGCYNLKKIVGNACKIRTIPRGIGKCIKLKDMNLAANSITVIPSEIGQLSQLSKLSLGNNQISQLPDSFNKLDKLWFCGLGHNHFIKFPKQVLGLSNVQNLWLHDNSFDSVPIEITEIKSLTHLLVDITEIAESDIKKIKDKNPKIRIIDKSKRLLQYEQYAPK